MSSGIFKRNIFGELEEVKPEHVRAWCEQCQFPYGDRRCQGRDLIQRCWFELQAIATTLKIDSEAHIWHLQHECPYIHRGLPCRCNDFKTVEGAFREAGLEYRR